MRTLAILGIAAVIVTTLAGCRNSPDQPVIDAAAIFQQNCSPCHGAERQGNVCPSLTAEALQTRGRTDVYITETITNGRGGMPVWKGRLTPGEIEAIVKFLRK